MAGTSFVSTPASVIGIDELVGHKVGRYASFIQTEFVAEIISSSA